MIAIVNNKEYSINLDAGKLEIEFDNSATGLRKVFVFQDLTISELSLKRAETIYYSYDITPTGQRINKERYAYATSEEDFNDFENGMIGFVLKRSIANGFFRFIDKSASAVFNEQGNLIQ
jgi:hypothetical protein